VPPQNGPLFSAPTKRAVFQCPHKMHHSLIPPTKWTTFQCPPHKMDHISVSPRNGSLLSAPTKWTTFQCPPHKMGHISVSLRNGSLLSAPTKWTTFQWKYRMFKTLLTETKHCGWMGKEAMSSSLNYVTGYSFWGFNNIFGHSVHHLESALN